MDGFHQTSRTIIALYGSVLYSPYTELLICYGQITYGTSDLKPLNDLAWAPEL